MMNILLHIPTMASPGQMMWYTCLTIINICLIPVVIVTYRCPQCVFGLGRACTDKVVQSLNISHHNTPGSLHQSMCNMLGLFCVAFGALVFVKTCQHHTVSNVDWMLWACQFTIMHLQIVLPDPTKAKIAQDDFWIKMNAARQYQNDNLYKFIDMQPIFLLTFMCTTLAGVPTNAFDLLRAGSAMQLSMLSVMCLVSYVVTVYHITVEKLEAHRNTVLTTNMSDGAFSAILISCMVYYRLFSLCEWGFGPMNHDSAQMCAIVGWLLLLIAMVTATFCPDHKGQYEHSGVAAGVCAVGMLAATMPHRIDRVWFLLGTDIVYVQEKYSTFCLLAVIWHASTLKRQAS